MRIDEGPDPWSEECPNTGRKRENCRCMNCFSDIFRFKWILDDAKNIDGVIRILQDVKTLFESLREKGYTVGGGIADDYLEIQPPKKEGYYWMRCDSCGIPYEVQEGAVPPGPCPKCDLEEDIRHRTGGRD